MLNGTALGYDADGLLVTAGALTLRRDPANGMLTGTTLAGVSDAWLYDEHGDVREYAATFGGTPVAKFTYERDAVGRIAKVTEVSGRTTTVLGYGYDRAGRLETVTTNGTYTTTYAYDANSNRSSKTTGSVTETGTYDAEDRVQTWAGTSFAFTETGELTSRTDGSGTTSYVYDALGSLRKVTMPSGTVIEYLIDAQNRRVGRKVNGTRTHCWLYADALRIVAELDGSGTILSRFVYGSRTNVPDYVVRGGVTYRILSDHLGSPRLVVNTTTGEIVQAMTYDEFGNVLSDTNPGFQPFGFAGGLYDAATGLVRFGARDYDARVGRWTTKEPMLFGGGDPNLYAYVFSDPVQMVDPNGRDALCYDGTMLWDFNDAGQTVMVRPATSGRDGVTDPTQRDKGPIPEGTYIINPGEISEVNGVRYLARNARGDWGHFRVPLHPLTGTETYGRDGFFIHGGRLPGSAGCVDVDGAENEIFGRLKKQQGPMALRVGKCR